MHVQCTSSWYLISKHLKGCRVFKSHKYLFMPQNWSVFPCPPLLTSNPPLALFLSTGCFLALQTSRFKASSKLLDYFQRSAPPPAPPRVFPPLSGVGAGLRLSRLETAVELSTHSWEIHPESCYMWKLHCGKLSWAKAPNKYRQCWNLCFDAAGKFILSSTPAALCGAVCVAPHGCLWRHSRCSHIATGQFWKFPKNTFEYIWFYIKSESHNQSN